MSSKTPFWKRKSASLPGSSVKSLTSQSPHHGPRHKLSFKEFEDHTDDAWDATDDDLLRAALTKVEVGSAEQVRATAQVVIENHSRLKTSNGNHSGSSTSIPYQVNEEGQKTPESGAGTRKFPGIANRTRFDSNQSQTDSADYVDALRGVTQTLNISQTSGDSVDTSKSRETDRKDNENLEPKSVLHPPNLAEAGSAPRSQSIRLPLASASDSREHSKIKKFEDLISSETTDLDDLKKLSWSGIPSQVRPVTWQLLSCYLPTNRDRRECVLQRKRHEYFNFVEKYYESRLTTHQQTYQQIHIDIPRTNPLIPLFQQTCVQHIFERLLFVWAVRHPASGYVQGINDLVTPFFIVFLSSYLHDDDERRKIDSFEVASLGEVQLRDIEADTYWCVCKLLDGIQDNYTFAQPGVQMKVNHLRELTKRVDGELHAHFEKENIEYLQFAFRWMNNLLMREIPLSCTIRLWDTYLSESDGFSDFHIYVCAAFLKQWRNQLLCEDFQGLMLMIQNVPTHHWGEEEIKLLLAEAFRLKYTFADTPRHLSESSR